MGDESPSLFDIFGDEEKDAYQEVPDDWETSEPVNEETDPSVPPSYLMAAILAGLYELPPLHILRYQTGWGRRVRYDPEKLIRLQPNFSPLGLLETSLDCPVQFEQMALKRYFFSGKNSRETDDVADFCIYRVRVLEPASLNQQLREDAINDQRFCPTGIEVSNAGGAWHGKPHFFHERNQSQLHQLIVKAITAVEQRQPHAARLQLEPSDIESWANISKEGSWNRLHTHEGSLWSGVYYVCAGGPLEDSYGGRLVLKPTAHPRENDYILSKLEEQRFFNQSKGLHKLDVDCCEFLDLNAVPGHMLIFPSWLHHCVLPISSSDAPTERISIAFNINVSSW